ncbi:hypothetical protein [Candidatus Uabimicrobium amorphum]|uniref:Uncharacterized protein n=1 Tax=Uabimicrobium amorphum TaxID=2596890 RepID=A0A5S9IMU5_UABAM|nr:hypothetical protein [Candidatus Uabimicrobium amorphum]BBM84769.1 hypothetical protein UABAM_03130 [Candidatus Uabimicrobium amorphum]
MSNQEGQENKFVVYLEGFGCFVFFIGLVVGFLFLAMKMYKQYEKSQANARVVESRSKKSRFSKSPEKKRAKQKTEQKKESFESRRSEVIFRTFVESVRNAQSEEQVNQIFDYFVRKIPMSQSDKERMRKFADLRIKQLTK